jgi:hypothetical protein
VAGLGERHGQPPGPDRELEDRAVGAVGKRQIEVQVAGIVGQVEVIEARERGSGRRVRSTQPG